MMGQAKINNEVKHSLLLRKAHMDSLEQDVGKTVKLLADWCPKGFS